MFGKKNVDKAVTGLQKVIDDLSQVADDNEAEYTKLIQEIEEKLRDRDAAEFEKARAEAIKAKIQELLSA